MDYDLLNQKFVGKLIQINVDLSQWDGSSGATVWFDPFESNFLVLEVINEQEIKRKSDVRRYSAYRNVGESRLCMLVLVDSNIIGLLVYLDQVVLL